MDAMTEKILGWDLDYLTAEQEEFLHALRNQVQKLYIQEFYEKQRNKLL